MFAIIKILIALWLVDKIHAYLLTIGIDGPVSWLFAAIIPFAAIIAWAMVSTPNVNRGNNLPHRPYDHDSDGY